MDKILTTFHNRLLPFADSIGYIVYAMAGIAALYYIGDKVWGAYSRGEPIDVYPLLRPFVVAVLILNFDTLVVTPIHYVLAPLRTTTARMIRVEEAGKQEKAQLYAAVAKKRREEQQKKFVKDWEEKSTVAKVGTVAMDAVVSAVALPAFLVKKSADLGFLDTGRDGITDFLVWILSGIRYFVVYFYKMLRIFFLSLLNLIGPIAFAFSLFPGFGSSLTNWISKYISIYLWLPICNILNLMLSWMDDVCTEVLLGDNEFGIRATLIFFNVVAIAAHLSIPTISTWIISNGETGATRGLQSIGRVMGSVLGAVAGGWLGAALSAGKKKKE